MDLLFKDIYFNPKQPASFTSKNKLFKAAKNVNREVNKKDVSKWLDKQDIVSVHKPVVTNFKRSTILTNGIGDLFEADLMDMSNVSKFNDKINFVLLVIDAFSKKLWAHPLRSKNAKDVLEGFQKIIEKSGTPVRIRTDSGTEFKNQLVQNFFNENKIKHYVAHNEKKAAIVERVIRTIKKKINRFFSYNETNRYVNELQNMIDSYNDTFHRSIKSAPNKVNKNNEREIWKRLYLKTFTKAIKPIKFKIGDKVRISRLRTTFPRGYYEGYTQEYFLIKKIIKSIPNRYILKDILNEDITGSFYEPELVKVNNDDDEEFKIEKIVATRGRGRNKQVLIKWLGWPEKFNTWEPASAVKDL